MKESDAAQLAAYGVAKTPALLALTGTDVAQRVVYEGGCRLPPVVAF